MCDRVLPGAPNMKTPLSVSAVLICLTAVFVCVAFLPIWSLHDSPGLTQQERNCVEDGLYTAAHHPFENLAHRISKLTTQKESDTSFVARETTIGGIELGRFRIGCQGVEWQGFSRF